MFIIGSKLVAGLLLVALFIVTYAFLLFSNAGSLFSGYMRDKLPQV